MTNLGQKNSAASRARAAMPAKLRSQARKTINELITCIDKRANAALASKRYEDWTYAELYLHNLRKARELLRVPQRTTSR